ncbi:MAG: hypothetical protein KAS87_00350 [Candidatus Omnitrophica bacterium]|nr:hypothetical protein [Candidatus Omnitrophota bacterium]
MKPPFLPILISFLFNPYTIFQVSSYYFDEKVHWDKWDKIEYCLFKDLKGSGKDDAEIYRVRIRPCP